MNLNNLKVHELNYELKIQGLEVTGTVDVKWKLLRGSVNQENSNRSFIGGIVNPYDFVDYVSEMRKTISGF